MLSCERKAETTLKLNYVTEVPLHEFSEESIITIFQQSNAAVTGDNEGDVRGIRMSKISGIERM